MAQGRLKPNAHKLVAYTDEDLNYRELVDANLQDQTTDAIIACFNQVTNSTTLTAAVPNVLENDTYIVSVADATGIVNGSYLILFDPASIRFTTFFVISVDTLDITLDSPVDFEYPIGTFVDVAIVDMDVDGSGTPEVFGLRGTGAPPGVELSFDLTRIIITCTTATPVTLPTFGDLTALTRGLLLRERNGRVKNIFNCKTNAELAGIMFDFTPYLATNPAQGQDGFVCKS